MVTAGLMEASSSWLPEAHRDARRMAALAEAAYKNGCFENVEAAAAAIVRKKDTTMPSPQLVEKYEKGYAKFKQFYPALKGKY